jgi:mRNA-degrading endonuclease RelE of RelBE toxin-antitoxin system
VASPRRGKTRPYDIDYAESAVEHLRHLTARDRAIVVDAIERRLRFEPTTETPNRKRMEENALGAAFELRAGNLRVYYQVNEDARAVNILAVGYKDRDRVTIGGEAIEL